MERRLYLQGYAEPFAFIAPISHDRRTIQRPARRTPPQRDGVFQALKFITNSFVATAGYSYAFKAKITLHVLSGQKTDLIWYRSMACPYRYGYSPNEIAC